MDNNIINDNIEFKLRPCNQEDYDFCHNLFKSNMTFYAEKHWGGWNPNFFIKNFNWKNSMMIEVKGNFIGFYEIEVKGNLGIVHDIQIKKKYTRKGIGTNIMKLIEKKFKKKDAKKAKLKVFIDNPARQLYERLGYKEIKKSNSVGTIIMEKELD